MNEPQSHQDTENTHIAQINMLTSRIIACAIAVHRALGPGLLEQIYESAMCIELEDCAIPFIRQTRIPAYYKGKLLGEYRVDLVVGDLVLVEVKCVERLNPVHEAQVLTYLRLTGERVGLLINFNSRLLKEGIKRLIL
ncbi:MAG: GxxExxY protein [Vicinamibacterales bacterium]